MDMDELLESAELSGDEHSPRFVDAWSSHSSSSGEGDFGEETLLADINVPIMWDDVSYRVKKSDETFIIEDVYGLCKPGEALLLMGASGSGKTTLVKLLSGHVKSGEAFMNYRIGNRPITHPKALRGVVSLVTQEDVIFEAQTVLETIRFSARLRLRGSRLTKDHRARTVCEALGLEHVRNSIIGSESSAKRISDGERKRVHMAVTLVKSPVVLMLDEPTTGLDPATAEKVISVLVDVARRARIPLICVLHQPNYFIFTRFDKVGIMTKGHMGLYSRVTTVLEDLEACDLVLPERTNIADYLLDIFDRDSLHGASPEAIEQLSLDSRARFNAEVAQNQAVAIRIEPYNTFGATWGEMAMETAKRTWRQRLRVKSMNFSRLFGAIYSSLLLVLTFLQLGNDQQSIRMRNGCIFFLLIANAFPGLVFSLSSFVGTDREVFRRGRHNYELKCSAFILGDFLTQLPWELFYVTITVAISYYAVGFKPGFQYFLLFWFVAYMTLLITILFARTCAVWVETYQVALLIGANILVIFILFSGIYVSSTEIVPWLGWITAIDYIRYAIEILLYSQYTGLTFVCTPDEQLPDGTCPLNTGEEVLKSIGMDDVSIGENIIYLFIFLIVYLFLYFLGLFIKVRVVSLFAKRFKSPAELSFPVSPVQLDGEGTTLTLSSPDESISPA